MPPNAPAREAMTSEKGSLHRFESDATAGAYDEKFCHSASTLLDLLAATPCQSLEACLIDQIQGNRLSECPGLSLLHRFFEISGCSEVLSLLRILGIKYDDNCTLIAVSRVIDPWIDKSSSLLHVVRPAFCRGAATMLKQSLLNTALTTSSAMRCLRVSSHCSDYENRNCGL